MRFRSLLYGAVVFFILLGAFSLWFSVKKTETMTPAPQGQGQGQEQSGSSDLEANGVTFTVTQGDQKKWDLLVEHVVYEKSRTQATLEGVTGTFYSPLGQPIATFESPTGLYDDQVKSMQLTGGAKVVSLSSENTYLVAPGIDWNASSDWIKAKGGVNMVMGGALVSTGEQCLFALDFSSMTMTGGTETTVVE